ncbi:MAG TPA: hypothetical protein VHK01_20440 [Lacipirellulaceae bacterium]|nr:hypothetical protein [Lacipirellulaceae bacterium]
MRTKLQNTNHVLLWIALACGVIPLIIGSAIYFAFRATRLDWLPIAGYFTILAGLTFFAVGVMCLVAYVYRRRGLDLTTFLLGALLFSNFPAAAIYGLSAIGLMTQYVVQVVNESDAVIDSFLVEGPGVRTELGPIQIGESKQCRVFFDADGNLTFNARQQPLRFDGEIEGYVTNNLGGEARVQIKPGGKFVVLHPDRKSNDD